MPIYIRYKIRRTCFCLRRFITDMVW